MADDLQTVRALIELLTATPLDAEDQLLALEITWIVVAGNARASALLQPGAFQAEKRRQVRRLTHLIELLAADKPNLDLERACQEGDIRGVADWTRHAIVETDLGPDEDASEGAKS